MKVQVLTLGCSKNRVDSEHILRHLEAGGWEVSPEGEDLSEANVDVLLINTCGFIKDAKEESIESIFAGVDAKKDGLISELYVMGCLSQRYPVELRAEIPEVDRFFGAYDLDSILEAFSIKRDSVLETQRHLTTPSHYAYLKVSEGCDRSCSYCAIPGIRGPHRSTPIEDLVREAEYLADKGVKELLLVAQDTTFYGLDLYKKRALATLMSKLEEVKGIEWIRLHYTYPSAFPDDVLELMASSKKICNYMDIPLQHSSSKVLEAMRRGIDGPQTRALVEQFREKVPGIVLRTTMIVGHPGETEQEYDDLIDFIRTYRFERLGAFTYSEEEGTYGAINFEDSIPEEVKQERFEELMEIQSEISLYYNHSRVGTQEKVLIDSYEDGHYIGRTSSESPGVDGEVLIKAENGSLNIGDFKSVKIVEADEYDLRATLL